MNILIDIGNSTIVVALASNDGTITHTWRFKTRIACRHLLRRTRGE